MRQGAARIDGIERLTGAAKYTDDFAPPGLLVGQFLRSCHARAKILRIDIEKAAALPGVKGILTGVDLPQKYGIIPGSQDETALAQGWVSYVGEPVVAVAAVSHAVAQAAIDLITVDYAPEAPILTIDDALLDEARVRPDLKTNILRDIIDEFGPVDANFEGADWILERVYRYGPSSHIPMEPHSSLAHFEPSGRLTLISSTQVPHYLQKQVAQVLGLDEGDIRVIKPHVGGGFGGKSEAFSADIVAAALSQRSGRPVRFTSCREESFYSHRGRHDTWIRLRSAHDKRGHFKALEIQTWLNTGAYASYGVVTTHYSVAFGAMPYHTPALRYRAQSLYTNTPPAGPKRGNGAIQPRFAIEAHLDEVAAHFGRDPADLRREMLLPAQSETINGLKITTNGMAEALDRVLETSNWAEARKNLPEGVGMGLALSAYISGAGHSIYRSDLPHSQVMVKVDRSGLLTIYCGAAEIGQGSTTVMALIFAEKLGLDLKFIRVVEGDTDLTPVDLGSYSSRVTLMVGRACTAAADALIARFTGVFATARGWDAQNIVFKDGALHHGDEICPWRDAIAQVEATTGPIVEVGAYAPESQPGARFAGGGAGPSPAYSFTAQVARVRVDRETGEVRVEKIWCAHDCGEAVNPLGVVGQIEGCLYMGQGEALNESMTYHRGGQLVETSLLDYTLPTTLDICDMQVDIIESGRDLKGFQAKEAGEGPQLSTVPAIYNALHQALGCRIRSVPVNPEHILRHLDGKARPIRAPKRVNAEADAKAQRRLKVLLKRRGRGRRGQVQP